MNVGRLAGCICLGLLALATASCGSSRPREPVFPVKGKVMVAGMPAGGAHVGLHKLSDRENYRLIKPHGTVQKDGSFTLSTFDSNDGAPAGEYAVTIYWPGERPKNAKPTDPGPDQLEGRYANPAKTELRATVKKEETVLEYNLD